MKIFAYSAASVVALAVCSASFPAVAQEEPAGDETVVPPIVSATPEGEEGQEAETSLFDLLAQSTARRLDPEQRAQSLLDDLPFTPALEPAALADRFTRTNIIHRSVGIDVPFRLSPIEGDSRQGTVWHKGNPPKDGFLAEMQGSALSAATAQITWKDGTTADVELYEAQYRDTFDRRSLTDLEGKVYCAKNVTTPSGPQDFCLVDRNVDGAFEEYALISASSGKSVHSAVVMTAGMPLAVPAPYIVRTDDLPELRAQWVTCGRDWDLPHYSIRLSRNEHGETKVYAGNPEYTNPYCEKSLLAEIPIEERGAKAAYMGPAIAIIGPKKSGAKLRIAEYRGENLLYRIESEDRLTLLKAGYAPQQANLAATQRFDRLPFQSTGQVEVAQETFKIGEPFLTSHFRHGYTGEVTDDVKIRLLFSSRSVDGGMPVYGIPAKRETVTVSGYGYTLPTAPAIERMVDMAVIWCLPEREEKPVRDRNNQPTGEVMVEWTATCLPENSEGNHTILQDQSPALAVRNMSMSTTISSKPGRAPIVERPTADFGAPLSFAYVLKEAGEKLYLLQERVMLGDEVTSTSETALLRDTSGKALIEVGGGSYMLEPDGDGFKLAEMLPVSKGEDARVKGLDIMNLLRQILAAKRDNP